MKITAAPCLTALLLVAGSAVAAESTPVGTWKTIDDNTHEVRSLVQITEDGDSLDGSILKIFPKPDADPDPVCDKCEGDLKGHKVVGLQIIDGVKKKGDHWSGGTILDPESGKLYKVKLTPSADGEKLEVRGFIGVSLLGRTQVWERAEDTAP